MQTPAVSSSQPIGLPTRRTISAPRVAYATVEIEFPTWEMASFALKSPQVTPVRTAPAMATTIDPAHKPLMRREPDRPGTLAASGLRVPAAWLSVLAVMSSSVHGC